MWISPRHYFKLRIILIVLFLFCDISNCQILEGLKDAVLSAEGIFGEVFRSLNSVVKQVKFTKEAWEDSIDEECRFSCPNGNTPKKNKYHKPSSDGCGVPGMEINVQYLPFKDMTKCCDIHDICYGTCNKDKDECDLAFKKCLYKLCDSSKKEMTDILLTGCKSAAKMLYSGTMMFGCKYYKSAQQQACYCGSGKFAAGEL